MMALIVLFASTSAVVGSATQNVWRGVARAVAVIAFGMLVSCAVVLVYAQRVVMINNEDWLIVGTTTPDKRSVMKELGQYHWGDSFIIPALEPLPMLKEAEQREITVDSSADTHQPFRGKEFSA